MKKIIISVVLLLLYSWKVAFVTAQSDYTLIRQYPSDATNFTQGLEVLDDGRVVETTGLYGQSRIGIVDMETGSFHEKDKLEEIYFGEGMTEVPTGIWQVTWKSGIAFLRDKDTLEVKDSVTYAGEGWGLAYDMQRKVVWHSDGTARLHQRDSQTFEWIKSLDVTYRGVPIDQLNELEYANGYVYANVWQTNDIVKIDVETGDVVARYDMTELITTLKSSLSQKEADALDVLNGIAHIEGNRFYVTGKLFPVVWEVELH